MHSFKILIKQERKEYHSISLSFFSHFSLSFTRYISLPPFYRHYLVISFLSDFLSLYFASFLSLLSLFLNNLYTLSITHTFVFIEIIELSNQDVNINSFAYLFYLLNINYIYIRIHKGKHTHKHIHRHSCNNIHVVGVLRIELILNKVTTQRYFKMSYFF